MIFSRRQLHKGGAGPPTMHLPPAVYEMFAPKPKLEFLPLKKRRANYKIVQDYVSSISEVSCFDSVFEMFLLFDVLFPRYHLKNCLTRMYQ